MMQGPQSNIEQFRETLRKIDYLFHVKEFKSIRETKIDHLKQEKKYQPPDFDTQARRMHLHMIYLYYLCYVKQIDVYIYPRICINKWGVIFKYYSFNDQHAKFMDRIDHQQFKKNIKQDFIAIWNMSKKENELDEDGQQQQDQSDSKQQKKSKQQQVDPWTKFCQQMVQLQKKQENTPKQIITKLQDTTYMKNAVLILGVLSSTIFPCIKFNNAVQRAFNLSYEEQYLIVRKIFNKDYENQGTKQFVNSIVRFFKILNDFKILGITTTLSEKSLPRSEQDESLLTQFFVTLGRPIFSQDNKLQHIETLQEKNSTSNQSSQHDYNQGNQTKDMGQLKYQFFWGKKLQTKELNFRITILVNKKIYPLYFNEIEQIWYRLSDKWKVILNENKQLSGFNPGFIVLDYNKDTYHISFTDYVKYQPSQHVLSELILATDKLIIAALSIRDVISFYQKKSLSVDILKEDLVINDGRLQNMAQSVCQTIKNYNIYCKNVLNSVQSKSKN